LGNSHFTALEKVPATGSPFDPRAGSNRALFVTSAQVAASSSEWPVDPVTVQLVTLPVAAISSLNRAVPVNSRRAQLGR
tara:strand:- start:310 stop:546 length:237 start_codon:yes stop_codon:yes gene_type:complete